MSKLVNSMRNFNVNGYRVYSFLNVLLAIIAGLALPIAVFAGAEYGSAGAGFIGYIFLGILVVAGALALLIKRNMKLGDKKLIIKYTILQVILSIFVLIFTILGWALSASNKMDDLQSR